ncbi:uncharacterized protein LOC119163853 isoform X6 [Rhipicephalus microplus]|uniref:uncharacterized protein LOC119163853 isoform X6 n=1 Tax=Rhipicephalus microplus TaxID=6941 RepID=UPI003F6D023B
MKTMLICILLLALLMAFQAQDLGEDDLERDLLHGYSAHYDQFDAPEVEGREQSFKAHDLGEDDLKDQGVQA